MKPPEKSFRAGIVIGALLALGPLWGFCITMYGTLRAFSTLGDNGLNDRQALAHNVGLSLGGTAIGLLLCPVGVAVLGVSLAWRARARRLSPPPLPVTPAP